MSKPARPEYDTLTAQATKLRLILGGTSYHTSIGSKVYVTPRPLNDPDDHIACIDVEINPRGRPYNDKRIILTWSAMVSWSGDDDAKPLNVLADMRSALLCTDPKLPLAIDSARIHYPEPGGNYAIVLVVTSIHSA